jgi:hypothetical protein
MKTKVTIEHGGINISAEIDNDSPSPMQVMELFRAVFLGATYSWEQWHEEIRRQAEEGE